MVTQIRQVAYAAGGEFMKQHPEGFEVKDLEMTIFLALARIFPPEVPKEPLWEMVYEITRTCIQILDVALENVRRRKAQRGIV